MNPTIIISKDFTFEASHILPLHKGKCSRLHGHSWQLRVSIIGFVDRTSGFVMDYALLKEIVNENIIDLLDHAHLGQGTCLTQGGYMALPHFGNSFYPSSENLVVEIAKILEPLIKEESNEHSRLYEVELKETCTSAARFRPDSAGDYR